MYLVTVLVEDRILIFIDEGIATGPPAFLLLCHWDDQGMEVWCRLVEVTSQSHHVLLPELVTKELVEAQGID